MSEVNIEETVESLFSNVSLFTEKFAKMMWNRGEMHSRNVNQKYESLKKPESKKKKKESWIDINIHPCFAS